jgi:hypothetical protein
MGNKGGAITRKARVNEGTRKKEVIVCDFYIIDIGINESRYNSVLIIESDAETCLFMLPLTKSI